MSSLTTILLAYTSIVLTIIMGILGFVLYHFLPVKSRVDQMWRELYGGETGDGHIAESDEDHESLRDLMQNTQSQNQLVHARMDRLVRFLNDLSSWLDKNGDSDRDPPHLHEDNYIDEEEFDGEVFYRGGTDD